MNQCKLERWFFKMKTANPYQAPELGVPCISGHVFNHPDFQDDSVISSGMIVSVDKEKLKIKTKNSLYTLGSPNPDYIKEFPNYMDIFDKFPKENL